ncbi:hypothetical protein SPV_2474 [Streptococcus pneumoniae]|nr:hypothetical protein SPV_2474 [Streptococcus pneumoniae]
MLQAFLSCTSL